MKIKIERLSGLPASRISGILGRCSSKINGIMLGQARSVVEGIKKHGDGALLKYIKKYEGINLSRSGLTVGAEEIRLAYKSLPSGVKKNLETMVQSVRRFSEKQLTFTKKGWSFRFREGYTAGQLLRPLESVGVYVPGGRACYPSTAVMGIVPARVAGVKKVVVATPADRSGRVPAAVIVAAAWPGLI